jgi:hypothetical protein
VVVRPLNFTVRPHRQGSVTFLVISSAGAAIAGALMCFIGAFAGSKRDSAFLRTVFPGMTILLVALSIGAALLRTFSPSNLSVEDAFLLRHIGSGWSYVLIAYSMLAAWLLGSVIGALRPKATPVGPVPPNNRWRGP